MPELRIIFADDEPNVLSGLRRMLHRYRKDWEMVFCEGADQALAAMAEQPFDVIITDMRMPGVTGADLLKQIHTLYPATVRIVLSGHCNQDLILQSVGFAHQYLAKPCSAEDMNAAIKRSLELRRFLSDPELHERISKIRSLPTPPTIYQQLIAATKEEDPCPKRIAGIMAEDVGLTTKLFQIINSAFFSLPCHVSDTLHAVNLLGLDNLQSLVIATGVFNEFEVEPIGSISPNGLRSHGLQVGQVAREVARHWRLHKQACEDAYLAGLLHDVGKLVEISYFPAAMREVVSSLGTDESLTAAEQRVMGVHHGQIGAHLLSLWGLPDTIIEAVAFHHQPGELGGSQPCVLAAVHVANALVNDKRAAIDSEYMESIGLVESLDELAAETTCEVT